jgi:hypothetical protein
MDPKASSRRRIVLLAILNCLGWAIACLFNWSLRTGDPFGYVYTSERVSQNTQVAVVVSAALILTIAGTIAFIARPNGFGLPLLAVVQAADVVAILVRMNLQIPDAWSESLVFSVAPAFTLLVIAMLWQVRRHSANPVARPDL